MKKIALLSLVAFIGISAQAATLKAGSVGTSVLSVKELEQIKKDYPELIGKPGIKIVKGVSQGKFSQLQLEASTPRGPQVFDVFVVKGINAVFAGNAYKASGEKYSLPVNEKVIKDGVAFKIGNGPTQLYLVTDPECPYCQKLESEINPNVYSEVTINVIPMPLSFHKNAIPMYQWVLAGTDKGDRLHKVMTGNKEWESFKPTEAQVASSTAIFAASNKAAMELNAGGTPSLYDAKFQKADFGVITAK
jgi:thiol:disulfide interchange protein DsbC